MPFDIVEIVGVFSAIGVLLGSAWKLHKFLSNMEAQFHKYDETLRSNTIHILKMSLLSEDLPILDRINAGRKYLELGGNGYGQIVYEELLEKIKENPPTTIGEKK